MLQRGYGENETTAISSRKKRSWRRVEKGWERLKLTHAIGQNREVFVITYMMMDLMKEMRKIRIRTKIADKGGKY